MDEHWIKTVGRIGRVAASTREGEEGCLEPLSALAYIEGLTKGLLSRDDARITKPLAIDTRLPCRCRNTHGESCPRCVTR